MDHTRPEKAPHEKLIKFVTDRPGHDFRYAMDTRKIQTQLGWRAEMDFDMGLQATVEWYIDNQDWVGNVSGTKYSGERMGILEE